MASIHQLKNEARRCEQREEWDGAIELYREAIRRFEESEHVAPDLSLYNRLGDLYQRRGETATAVSCYERAVDQYAEQGLHTSAIALCNKILRIAPGRGEVYRKLGRLQAATGLVAEARNNFLRFAEDADRKSDLDGALAAIDEVTGLLSDEQARVAFAAQLQESDRQEIALQELRKAWLNCTTASRDADAAVIRDRILVIDPAADPILDPPRPEPSASADAAGAPETDEAADGDVAPPAAAASDAAATPRGADELPPAAATPDAATVPGPATTPPAETDAASVTPAEGAESEPLVDLGSLLEADLAGALEVDAGRGASGTGPPLDPTPTGSGASPAGNATPERTEAEAELYAILERFREEVAEIVGDSDHAVRYDLGVAYREMGLLDEAIAEFQLAIRSPAHLAGAHEMLGRCLEEKRQRAQAPPAPESTTAPESTAAAESVPTVEGFAAAEPAPTPESASGADPVTAAEPPQATGPDPAAETAPAAGKSAAATGSESAAREETAGSPDDTAAPGDTAAPDDSAAPGDTAAPGDAGAPAGAADDAAGAPDPRRQNLMAHYFEARLAQFRTKQAASANRTDYKAHLDLGSAYVKMGLVEEAAREFEVAAGGPRPTAERGLNELEKLASDGGTPEPLRLHVLRRLGEAGREDAAVPGLLDIWRDRVDADRDSDDVRALIREIDPSADPMAEKERQAAEQGETPVAGAGVESGGQVASMAELARMLADLDALSEQGDAVPEAEPLTAPPPAAGEPAPAPNGAPATDPDAQRRNAWRLVQEGKREAASRELHRACEGYERRGQTRRAMEVLDRLLELHPDDAELHRRKVEYAFMTNDREILIRSYLDLAGALRRQDDSAGARAMYGRVADLDPSNPEVARALAELGELEAWQEAATATHGSGRASEAGLEGAAGRNGHAAHGGAQPAAAQAGAETAWAQGGGPPDLVLDRREAPAVAHAGRGTSRFLNLGDILRSELDGDARSPRFELEDVESDEDGEVDFDAMLDEFRFQLADSLDESDYGSHLELGIAFKQMGMLEEAIRELQIAIKEPDGPLRAHELLGECFISEGRFGVAAKLLERAAADPGLSDEDLIGVLYLLGTAYQGVGDPLHALECFERVYGVDIDFRDVTSRIAACSSAAS